MLAIHFPLGSVITEGAVDDRPEPGGSGKKGSKLHVLSDVGRPPLAVAVPSVRPRPSSLAL